MAAAVPAAVQTSLQILAAQRSLVGRSEPAHEMEEDVSRVVAAFDQAGARWALVGAHAVGLHTEPRATVGFDFIVEDAKLRSVVAILEGELGELEIQDIGPALRLTTLHVDLIRSTTHPIFAEALRSTRDAGDWQVPTLEVLVVLKFLSAVNPWRGQAKRTYDIGDLRSLVQSVGLAGLDRELMTRLACLVYPGAEREFDELLERISRGEPITI